VFVFCFVRSDFWDLRIVCSPSLTRFVSWAELNAPVVAFIYANCVVILLNANLLCFCPFESLIASKQKSLCRDFSFVRSEGFLLTQTFS
jgi:hypothetical protein